MRTLHEFSGQKILVTGASGFIGSNLCRCLCRNGTQVHAVSRTLRTTDSSCLRWWQSQVEPLFGALPDRPLEQVRVANTAYSYAKLGWQPVTSLEKGLDLTVEWYRTQLQFLIENG